MSDPAILRMKPSGRTCPWTYDGNQNFPGWHLCCDGPAAAFILALLDAMPATRWPGKKSLPLVADPDLTAATGCTAKPRFARSLEIHFAASNDPGLWRLEERAGSVSLSLGVDMIKGLRQGVQALASGQGDTSIGNNPGLWFWWDVRV